MVFSNNMDSMYFLQLIGILLGCKPNYHEYTGEPVVIGGLISTSQEDKLPMGQLYEVMTDFPTYHNDENKDDIDDHDHTEYLDKKEREFEDDRMVAGVEV